MLRATGVSTLISGNCKKFRNIASAVTKIVMQVMSSMLDFLCGMRSRGAGRGEGQPPSPGDFADIVKKMQK